MIVSRNLTLNQSLESFMVVKCLVPTRKWNLNGMIAMTEILMIAGSQTTVITSIIGLQRGYQREAQRGFQKEFQKEFQRYFQSDFLSGFQVGFQRDYQRGYGIGCDFQTM